MGQPTCTVNTTKDIDTAKCYEEFQKYGKISRIKTLQNELSGLEGNAQHVAEEIVSLFESIVDAVKSGTTGTIPSVNGKFENLQNSTILL